MDPLCDLGVGQAVDDEAEHLPLVLGGRPASRLLPPVVGGRLRGDGCLEHSGIWEDPIPIVLNSESGGKRSTRCNKSIGVG